MRRRSDGSGRRDWNGKEARREIRKARQAEDTNGSQFQEGSLVQICLSQLELNNLFATLTRWGNVYQLSLDDALPCWKHRPKGSPQTRLRLAIVAGNRSEGQDHLTKARWRDFAPTSSGIVFSRKAARNSRLLLTLHLPPYQ